MVQLQWLSSCARCRLCFGVIWALRYYVLRNFISFLRWGRPKSVKAARRSHSRRRCSGHRPTLAGQRLPCPYAASTSRYIGRPSCSCPHRITLCCDCAVTVLRLCCGLQVVVPMSPAANGGDTSASAPFQYVFSGQSGCDLCFLPVPYLGLVTTCPTNCCQDPPLPPPFPG